MWLFKQIEGLHSFKLEEDDKNSLCFPSNAVANYNNKNNNNNKTPIGNKILLVNKILFVSGRLILVPGQTFPYNLSMTETDRLILGTEKSPMSYPDCKDFLYFSQPIANN